jgi:hypothetical protein
LGWDGWVATLWKCDTDHRIILSQIFDSIDIIASPLSVEKKKGLLIF